MKGAFCGLLVAAVWAATVDDDFGDEDYRYPFGIEPIYEQLKQLTEHYCKLESVSITQCYYELAEDVDEGVKEAIAIRPNIPALWKKRLTRLLNDLRFTKKRKLWAKSKNHKNYLVSIGFHKALAMLSTYLVGEEYQKAGNIANSVTGHYGLDYTTNLFLSNAFLQGVQVGKKLDNQELMQRTQGWFHFVVTQGIFQSINDSGSGTLQSPYIVVTRLEVPRHCEMLGYEEYCAWDEDDDDNPVPDEDRGCGTLERWREEYRKTPEQYNGETLNPTVSQLVPSKYHKECDNTSCKKILQILVKNTIETRFLFFNVDAYFKKAQKSELYEGDNIIPEDGKSKKKKPKKGKKKKKMKKLSWKKLLKKWNLSKFKDAFEEEAWTEPETWYLMTEEDLTDLGLGKGHIAKFKQRLLKHDMVPKEEL